MPPERVNIDRFPDPDGSSPLGKNHVVGIGRAGLMLQQPGNTPV